MAQQEHDGDQQRKASPSSYREEQDPSWLEDMQQEVLESRASRTETHHWTRLLIICDLIIIILFSLLAIFAALFPVWSLDVTITRTIQGWQSPVVSIFMEAVSWPGYSAFLSVGMVFVATFLLWLFHFRLEALFLAGLSIVNYGCNVLIKYLINRPRPTNNLVEVFIGTPPGYSFPSGHVMSYMAFWGLIFAFTWILFKRDRWWRYLLLSISAFFMITVGPSRIYLGHHWASDVIAAYLFSFLLLGLTLWLYLRLKRRGVLEYVKK